MTKNCTFLSLCFSHYIASLPLYFYMFFVIFFSPSNFPCSTTILLLALLLLSPDFFFFFLLFIQFIQFCSSVVFCIKCRLCFCCCWRIAKNYPTLHTKATIFCLFLKLSRIQFVRINKLSSTFSHLISKIGFESNFSFSFSHVVIYLVT